MKKFTALLALLIPLLMLNFSSIFSQPSYCTASGSCSEEYISSVTFGEYQSGTLNCQTYLLLPSSYNPKLDLGKTYTLTATIQYHYSADNITAWIDWNQDGDFEDSGEEFVLKTSGTSRTLDIEVPLSAKPGKTGVRLRMEYNATPRPCGSNQSGWGNVVDFYIDLIEPLPDAHITAITTPTNLFRVGTHPINVTLRNSGDLNLTKVDIDWYVNNTLRGTYVWTGVLPKNNTTSFKIADFNFDYPADASVYGPFEIKTIVKNANNLPVDANPSNDIFTVNRTPILNDAGVLGFFGPPEGFGPGVTQVRARVRNYAPKPLTRVTINWKIDGITQTPVTLTGLNIKRDEVQDLIIGTYNFYAKTPLGPFTVECWTTMPNNVADEDASNDKFEGGIGPSLAAGYYYIGATNSQFTSPAEAASYLNASGVFGPGKVTFEIRPGTYTGQIVLNSSLPNKNEIEFVGGSTFPENIVIAANTTPQNNFVILLEGLDNVTFRNMTLRNNNNAAVGAGNIVTARNVRGLNFTNVTFMGVVNSTRYNTAFSIMNLTNCSPINISHCIFNNGSVSIHNTINSVNNPNIKIGNNTFSNFSWLGVYNQIMPHITPGSVDISFNKFSYISGLVPVGGIHSWNSTTINNNEFSGITGTGSLAEAVIYVNHASQNMNNPAIITKNSIIGCTNINGIFVTGAASLINKNYVNITQTQNYGYSLFRAEGVMGAIGNSQLAGTNIYAMNIINSPNLDVLYNSVLTEGGSFPAVLIGNAGRIWRNIFTAMGSGPAMQTGTFKSSNQNVFYSVGSTLINDNGVGRNLDSWKSRGYDPDSRFEMIEFVNTADLHIKIYNESLLFGPALFGPTDGFAYTIENSDIDGLNRISYYAGSHELTLFVTLIKQSKGVVNCIGSNDNEISVTSAIGYDAPMNYQWYRDGIPVPGATEPIMFFHNLQHHQAGLYHCRIGGPGATPYVYSNPVAVYVLRPTEITRYSKETTTARGDVATMWFEAHVNGKPIQDAIINNEVKVQWYYYVDGNNDRRLTNNTKISGVNSNYLTIRDFATADEGEYFAVIEGQCGTIKTAYMAMNLEVLDLTITQQPENSSACNNENIELNMTATTGSTKTIEYQWYKNGAQINDGAKYLGTKASKLTIRTVNTGDAGTYHCVATLSGTTINQRSANAIVSVLNAPRMTQDLADAEFTEESAMLLEVVVESNTNEMLTYIWYKDGSQIASGSALSGEKITYSKEEAEMEDIGYYMVVVTGACGSVESYQAEITIVPKTTDIAEVVSGGFRLSSPAPNPVNGESYVNYYVAKSGMVRMVLTDMLGSKSIELLNTNMNTGEYRININSSSLNLTTGVYYLIMESNGRTLMQKVSVVR